MAPPATATTLVPSADAATDDQFVLGASLCFHVAPASTEVKMPPPFTTAKILAPSAEQATACQPASGALVAVQVVPASLETKMDPLPSEPPAAATRLLPSAEEAMASTPGALVSHVQVCPKAGATAVNKPTAAVV